MAKVYVQFPKTGLGNLLLVWARAKIFSHINQLPLTTSSWWGFRWGAWIRNERKKRFYKGYFKESSFFERFRMSTYRMRSSIIDDPDIEKVNLSFTKRTLFLFKKVYTDDDLFRTLRPYRKYITEEIYQLLNPALIKQLKNFENPVIAVHIRRGDFKIANPITPLSFFIESIATVRKQTNIELPVTIFTDALQNEITDILNLPNVSLATNKADILDILLMSKSKVIILSRSSTFSYWGAFLSNALVIMSGNDWQQTIRDDVRLPEVRFDETNAASKNELIQKVKNHFEILIHK